MPVYFVLRAICSPSRGHAARRAGRLIFRHALSPREISVIEAMANIGAGRRVMLHLFRTAPSAPVLIEIGAIIVLVSSY